MFKGFVILLAVGIGFAYFVFNFVGDVEREDPNSYVSKNEAKARAWAKYYEKDPGGDPVLNLEGTPMKTAKEVWSESQLREEMLEKFPSFELMRSFVEERLGPSAFRRYLLERIDQIEGDYQGGAIDSEKARQLLTNL